MNAINTFKRSTDIEQLKHYRDRLQVLQILIVLDESVHHLLDDEEYAADAEKLRGIGGWREERGAQARKDQGQTTFLI
jgi:hypothetical protein